MTRHGSRGKDAVVALVSIHLSRLRRPVTAMLIGIVVLSGLDIMKHGVHAESILPWFLGGAMMLPLAPFGR